MESGLAYGFKKSWSPPASPSRDHYMESARPVSPISLQSPAPPQSPSSARTHRLKTVIRSSTPSPRRSPKLPTIRPRYNQPTEDEAQFDPSAEAEKTAELGNFGVGKADALSSDQEETAPDWNENVRWEDCVAFASELELSPREHPVEWLSHTLKDKKKPNPLHWPTSKERILFMRDGRTSPEHADRA